MLTGRRFRVEFTAEQAEYADRIASVCRAVWNTGLEQRREYRRRSGWMNYREQAGELAEAKAEHRWLAEVPGHCLQQTLMDLDKACRAHGTFRVRWRSGRRWRPSFRFPEGNKMVVKQLNGRHARVKLPKLGWVRFRLSRPLDDVVLRSATLTRDGRHWFVSFLVDDGLQTPEVHTAPTAAVGVDRGVVTALATSDGELFDRQFLTAGEQVRVVRLQRKLSRAARRGRNRDKVRSALAEIREREARRRLDFCAQTAHRLAAANAVVVLENLKTKQMTRSAKGTPNSPELTSERSPGSTAPSSPRGGTSSPWRCPRRPATAGRVWWRCRLRSRRNAAQLVGIWTRNPVRAKRYSGAPAASTGRCTRTSTLRRTYWP